MNENKCDLLNFCCDHCCDCCSMADYLDVKWNSILYSLLFYNI